MARNPSHDTLPADQIDCCPPLVRKPVCDTLEVRYQLPWEMRNMQAAVTLHYRLERCSGEMALGDLVYSTTLFPGERVRLFTSDRHTRWSIDAESELAYRHETTSEESYYTWGMARALTDLDISDEGSVSHQYEEDWSSGGGGLGLDFGIIKIGGGGGGGSFDAESTAEFARNLTRHAESSSSYSAAAVRAKSATSVGEVETRSHAEGESESHLESSSRTFRNPNRCHAVTYFFYKILKQQVVRFRLVAVEAVVLDPAAPTNPSRVVRPDLTGRVLVRPASVLATGTDRLEVERSAREAAIERETYSSEPRLGGTRATVLRASLGAAREPVGAERRREVLEALRGELRRVGLVDKDGNPAKGMVEQLSWEREEWLPTPGLLVKGCLDSCDTCEPALQREIELELDRMELENRMLERQVVLLEKSQEYRCCPEGEAEDENDEEPTG
jgi:hypothetical protein